jgi:hypothetical protein
MTNCRLASMVFEKAGGRGIVWRCLQWMYRPLLKENSRRLQHSFCVCMIDILCDILREKEVYLTSAGREIFVPFIVAEGIGFLCWRPGVYDIGRLLRSSTRFGTQPFPVQYHWVVRG